MKRYVKKPALVTAVLVSLYCNHQKILAITEAHNSSDLNSQLQSIHSSAEPLLKAESIIIAAGPEPDPCGSADNPCGGEDCPCGTSECSKCGYGCCTTGGFFCHNCFSGCDLCDPMDDSCEDECAKDYCTYVTVSPSECAEPSGYYGYVSSYACWSEAYSETCYCMVLNTEEFEIDNCKDME